MKTRPTLSKLRQALFNSLQTCVPEARVLDLFAGSGALGFEALSRGATFCVFVEHDRNTARLIERNAKALGLERSCVVLCETVEKSLFRLGRWAPFDLVLADPPYAEYGPVIGKEEADPLVRILSSPAWEKLLSSEARFCLETSVVKQRPEGLPATLPLLGKVREKNYGDTLLTTYARGAMVTPEEEPDA